MGFYADMFSLTTQFTSPWIAALNSHWGYTLEDIKISISVLWEIFILQSFHPEVGQKVVNLFHWFSLVIFIWTTMSIVSGSTATTQILCYSFSMHSAQSKLHWRETRLLTL